MIAYLLVVVLNPGGTNMATFSVPSIATAAECQRIGNLMQRSDNTYLTRTHCYAYRIAK